MRACASITCNDRALSLCHEPPNDPFEKAQKSLIASFEVICSCSEHDTCRVSGKHSIASEAFCMNQVTFALLHCKT